MANTTNLNLSKLAGTEKLKTFPSPYNDNMDAIDGAFGAGFGVSGKPTVNAEINSLADGLAIISNGNTHAAITSGQFVYVRGHGSLSDGLYVATANIAANATLSGSNLTADSSGGLNYLMANKAAVGNGSANSPVFGAVTVSNVPAGTDVVTFGGGISDAAATNNAGGILYSHSARRVSIRQKDTSNTYYDEYRLPSSSNISSTNNYDILTSKDFPFERIAGNASSGTLTFDATPSARHAIICCASFFFHLICNNNTDSNVYTDNLPSSFTLIKNGATYTLTRTNGNSFAYVILWI